MFRPINICSRLENHYILDIVDNYMSMSWSILLKNKGEAFQALQTWKKAQENKTELRIGKYCMGFDGELNSTEIEAWLVSWEVSNEHSAPHTSAYIGKVKYVHRILIDRARSMRIDAKCPKFLWDKFYMTVAHLHAKPPTKSLSRKTPYKMWHK